MPSCADGDPGERLAPLQAVRVVGGALHHRLDPVASSDTTSAWASSRVRVGATQALNQRLTPARGNLLCDWLEVELSVGHTLPPPETT